MLDAVAELAEYRVRNVERILGDKVNTHALGPNQPDHLLDFFKEGPRRFGKQQMRFVEEEHQLGFVAVADLGQFLEEIGQQPEQKGGIKPWRIEQPIGCQDVDDAPALRVGLHQIVEIEHRLAKEAIGALLIERDQPALDRADRGGRNVAVFGGELLGVVAHMLKHRSQILGIKQQQTTIIGNLEDQIEHPFLGLVEAEHA